MEFFLMLRDQKRSPHFLEMELQAVASHQMWALGSEPRFSIRAASAIDHWAISPLI